MADGAASPRPISPAERIDAIDVLRGLALLGVLAINVVTIFRVSIFERFFPQKPLASPIDSAVETVLMLAVTSALGTETINNNNNGPFDFYRAQEFSVDAFGSMSTLTHFLYSVEKDPLALKIDALEITARDNNGQQLSLALQVSGLVLNSVEQ